MSMGRALVLVSALLLMGCGGESGGAESVAVLGAAESEAAYQEAYTAAWIKSCKAAAAEIRKEAAGRAAQIRCDQPVEQMEGNTSFDPEQSRAEGRRQGTFDGCAYAWDEAYAAGGEAVPRC
jgi:hypothetical protein